MTRTIAAILAALWAAGSAWAGSSSYADSKTTQTISFAYAAADGTTEQTTRQNGCRSGVAYLEDGSTGVVELHGVPNGGVALSAATLVLTITGPGLANAVTFSDMPARYFRWNITTTATTNSQMRINCTNAG